MPVSLTCEAAVGKKKGSIGEESGRRAPAGDSALPVVVS